MVIIPVISLDPLLLVGGRIERHHNIDRSIYLHCYVSVPIVFTNFSLN